SGDRGAGLGGARGAARPRAAGRLARRPRRHSRRRRRRRPRPRRARADVPRLPGARRDAARARGNDRRARRRARRRGAPRRLVDDRTHHAGRPREAARRRRRTADAAPRPAPVEGVPLPVLRLERDAAREHLRPDRLPLAPLLRELPPAVRAVQDRMSAVLLVLSAFLASAVEMVEALTIVLAV